MVWVSQFEEGSYRINLDSIGFWRYGYRPFAVRVTLDYPNVDRFTIEDDEDNSLVDIGDYTSGSEESIVFFGDSTANDIWKLSMRDATSEFSITNIEFAVKVCSSSSSSSSSSRSSSSSSLSSSSSSTSFSSSSSSASSTINATKTWGENATDDYQGVAEDTRISEGPADDNFGGDSTIITGTEGTNQKLRTLIKFDLASLNLLIGSSNDVISAKLWMYSDYLDVVADHAIYKIKKDWNEGIGTGTAPALGESTWNDARYLQESWTIAGCSDTATDRDSTATDTITISAVGWVNWDITQDVKDFVDGSTNNGWIILHENEGGASFIITDFYSKENADDTRRPYVEIEFEFTESSSSSSSSSSSTP